MVITKPVMAEDAIYPNPALTRPDPSIVSGGVVIPVSLADLCHPDYTKTVRHVTTSVRREVYAAYGMTYIKGERELDHDIPLELGGSNSFVPNHPEKSNLWLQPYHTEWNARTKDRLENRMHKLVCSGALDLKQAQREISSDWITAFHRYIGPSPHSRLRGPSN